MSRDIAVKEIRGMRQGIRGMACEWKERDEFFW